jgi:CBS-domain-containing membrane protein
MMSKEPVSVLGSATATELAKLLDEHEISGAPVVDAQDRVIGVVSRTDLLRRCVEGPAGARPGTYLSAVAEGDDGSLEFEREDLGVVSEFMNPEPVTASPDDTPGAVARRMVDERVHRVIIVDDESRVLGIVTSLDMLKLVAA